VLTPTVRRVDASIARGLRVRAAERDLSAEELHRRILSVGTTLADLVSAPQRIGKLGLELGTPVPEGLERDSPRL
jgi:plasmid stability protein